MHLGSLCLRATTSISGCGVMSGCGRGLFAVSSGICTRIGSQVRRDLGCYLQRVPELWLQKSAQQRRFTFVFIVPPDTFRTKLQRVECVRIVCFNPSAQDTCTEWTRCRGVIQPFFECGARRPGSIICKQPWGTPSGWPYFWSS